MIFLMIVVLPLAAQTLNLSGRVADDETGNSLPDVTIYINGTTRGTTSDLEGLFELNGISLPCELIFSHVSYQLLRIYMDDNSQTGKLDIELKKKRVPIMEATVISDSAYQELPEKFRKWFLGKDYLETGARILNDSILRFIPLERDQFEAYADQPLLVELPYTGYVLKADLVHFELTEKEELGGLYCSILGYFYFEEPGDASWRQRRKLARNRMKTYYGSRDHFCRSLYENKLEENGYRLVKVCPDTSGSSLHDIHEADFKRSSLIAGTNAKTRVMELTDFNCDAYYIFYYFRKDHSPVDLANLYAMPPRMSRSELPFMQDTIHLFPSGRVAENALLFGGEMGSKGVAWTLPDDYLPPR